MSGILRALVNSGHGVTVFTPFTDSNRENYTEVDSTERAIRFLNMDVGDVKIDMLTAMDTLVETSRMQCTVITK